MYLLRSLYSGNTNNRFLLKTLAFLMIFAVSFSLFAVKMNQAYAGGGSKDALMKVLGKIMSVLGPLAMVAQIALMFIPGGCLLAMAMQVIITASQVVSVANAVLSGDPLAAVGAVASFVPGVPPGVAKGISAGCKVVKAAQNGDWIGAVASAAGGLAGAGVIDVEMSTIGAVAGAAKAIESGKVDASTIMNAASAVGQEFGVEIPQEVNMAVKAYDAYEKKDYAAMAGALMPDDFGMKNEILTAVNIGTKIKEKDYMGAINEATNFVPEEHRGTVNSAVNVADKIMKKDYKGAVSAATNMLPDGQAKDMINLGASAYEKIEKKDYIGLAKEVGGSLGGAIDPAISQKIDQGIGIYTAVKDKNYGAAIAQLDPNNQTLKNLGGSVDAALDGKYGAAIAGLDPNNSTLKKLGGATEAAMSGNYEDALSEIAGNNPDLNDAISTYKKIKSGDYTGAAVDAFGKIKPGTDVEKIAMAVDQMAKGDYKTAAGTIGNKFGVKKEFITAIQQGIGGDVEGAALSVANASGNTALKNIANQYKDKKKIYKQVKSGNLTIADAAEKFGIQNEYANKAINAYSSIKDKNSVTEAIYHISGKRLDNRVAGMIDDAANGKQFDINSIGEKFGVDIPNKDMISAVASGNIGSVMDKLPLDEKIKGQLEKSGSSLDKFKGLMNGDVSIGNLEAVLGDSISATAGDKFREMANNKGDISSLVGNLIGDQLKNTEDVEKMNALLSLAKETNGDADKLSAIVKENNDMAKNQAKEIEEEIKETEGDGIVVNVNSGGSDEDEAEIDREVDTVDFTKTINTMNDVEKLTD